jgi:hypothetical protein
MQQRVVLASFIPRPLYYPFLCSRSIHEKILTKIAEILNLQTPPHTHTHIHFIPSSSTNSSNQYAKYVS